MNPFHRMRGWHLLFALVFLLAYFTGDEGEQLHIWLGYGLLVLLAIRLGVALARTRGFPALWPSWPSKSITTTASRVLVIAMLLSAGVTLTTGLTMVDNARILGFSTTPALAIADADADAAEDQSGSFADEFFQEIEDIHEGAANTTLDLAGLHMAFLLAFRRRFALNMVPGLEALARYGTRVSSRLCREGRFVRFLRWRQASRIDAV